LLGSIMQDFGEVPDDHMDGINPSMYPDALESDGGENTSTTNKVDEFEDAITYREWDYTRQRFREAFCLLNEFDVPTGESGFVEETLEKYKGLLKSIKKTFEAVLGESKLQRKQSQGDDIDIDALVEAYADYSRGHEMSDYVYTQYRNIERNIAVMFMVDMSGSTLGWVNEAERESLILLCEALETLGDRYAIYGFSGRTNKRCEIYRVKRFDEPYNGEVRERISGIRPKSYTRMGVAIRHLGHLLNMTRARTKILITLSDGRPEDYGGYKGRYGIEDTRHALLELRRDGVHSFCITIDKEAQDYLPHMYGAANYAVIDEVNKLPLKVADIYRRLTT
jgi:nitric oxide reductase NorD protein